MLTKSCSLPTPLRLISSEYHEVAGSAQEDVVAYVAVPTKVLSTGKTEWFRHRLETLMSEALVDFDRTVRIVIQPLNRPEVVRIPAGAVTYCDNYEVAVAIARHWQIFARRSGRQP